MTKQFLVWGTGDGEDAVNYYVAGAATAADAVALWAAQVGVAADACAGCTEIPPVAAGQLQWLAQQGD